MIIKQSRAITFLMFLFFLSVSVFCQDVLAQGKWKEKIKEKIQEKNEKIKEKRSQRMDKRQEKAITGPGDYDFSLIHDGIQRTYRLHIPPSYQQTTPAPLVFSFHGGGGNSEIMADDSLYHLKSKSDQEGFVIVFPNGATKLKSGKFATWNAGNCCGYARDEKIDDVGFVKAMIDDLTQKLNIDKNKIYAMGFSNGGMLSHRLACDMSDVFKAIASVAGTENYDECNSGEPISILYIHARNDGHVLFNGGAGENFRDPSQVTDFTSVPETVSRWIRRNECNTTAQRILDVKGATCDLYSGVGNNSSVELCVTEEGGHSWPGGNKPREKSDTPSTALNATDVIWEFFKGLK